MPASPLKMVGYSRSGGSLHTVGQQLPGERDRLLLEVVAEGEVAEHLEERVMPQRRPDVVEVVVLAADPHALLRRRRARVGALLAAEERVLELVHPGVGEEQRRVVGRDERRARDDAVPVAARSTRGRLRRISLGVIITIHCTGMGSVGTALRRSRVRQRADHARRAAAQLAQRRHDAAGVKPWRIRYW